MEKRKLKDEKIILMRQDPPFDMNYITYTHFLEDIHPKTLVVNNPSEVRNAPEKLFVNKFKEFIPETLISRNYDDIYNFRKEYKDIIIKPLYGNGGKQIFHIDPNNQNFSSLLEMFFEKSNLFGSLNIIFLLFNEILFLFSSSSSHHGKIFHRGFRPHEHEQ